jgi:hypothetical protein
MMKRRRAGALLAALAVATLVSGCYVNPNLAANGSTTPSVDLTTPLPSSTVTPVGYVTGDQLAAILGPAPANTIYITYDATAEYADGTTITAHTEIDRSNPNEIRVGTYQESNDGTSMTAIMIGDKRWDVDSNGAWVENTDGEKAETIAVGMLPTAESYAADFSDMGISQFLDLGNTVVSDVTYRHYAAEFTTPNDGTTDGVTDVEFWLDATGRVVGRVTVLISGGAQVVIQETFTYDTAVQIDSPV